jgi:hypothetical protein
VVVVLLAFLGKKKIITIIYLDIGNPRGLTKKEIMLIFKISTYLVMKCYISGRKCNGAVRE